MNRKNQIRQLVFIEALYGIAPKFYLTLQSDLFSKDYALFYLNKPSLIESFFGEFVKGDKIDKLAELIQLDHNMAVLWLKGKFIVHDYRREGIGVSGMTAPSPSFLLIPSQIELPIGQTRIKRLIQTYIDLSRSKETKNGAIADFGISSELALSRLTNFIAELNRLPSYLGLFEFCYDLVRMICDDLYFDLQRRSGPFVKLFAQCDILLETIITYQRQKPLALQAIVLSSAIKEDKNPAGLIKYLTRYVEAYRNSELNISSQYAVLLVNYFALHLELLKKYSKSVSIDKNSGNTIAENRSETLTKFKKAIELMRILKEFQQFKPEHFINLPELSKLESALNKFATDLELRATINIEDTISG